MNTSVSISTSTLQLMEGSGGLTYFVYTVNRTGDLSGPTVLDYAVLGSGHTPAVAADFQNGVFPSGKVWFGGGESVKQIWVPVVGDSAAEPNESFVVNLSNVSGASLGTATAGGVISNDDGAPPTTTTISVADEVIRQAEGDAGSTPFTFTLTRSGDLSGASTVEWSVRLGGVPPEDGQAPASGADFVGGAPPAGSVCFAPGQASATVTVTVAGDVTPEPTNPFVVDLANPTGATLGPVRSGAGYIENDDGGGLRISAVQPQIQAEGQGGATAFQFTVTREPGTIGETTVNWSVGPGRAPPDQTATADDFVGGVAPSGTLTFAAGQTSAVITVQVAGDAQVEGNEEFAVTLSDPVNGYLIASRRVPYEYFTAFGRIDNDDAAGPPSGGTVFMSGPGTDYYTATAGADLYAYDAPTDGKDVVFNYDLSGADALQLKVGSGGFVLANQSGAGSATVVSPTGAASSIAGADVVIWSHPWQKLYSESAVDSMLATQSGTFNGGVFVVAHDGGAKVTLYYDADANSLGGVTALVRLDNLNSASSLNGGDFVFV